MAEHRHPGEILRKDYLEPLGFTITEAARQLGVSRQSLNNLVNAKSELSDDMVFRIAGFLHLTPEQVQGWQLGYELGKARSKAVLRRRTRGDSFVPQAADIAGWASTIQARYLLPQLVRLLVGASSGNTLYSHFPTGEEVQFSGFDGVVENPSKGIAYVPAGRSVWELSTEQNPQAKAQRDWEKRKSQPFEFNPGETIYVALTARRWASKSKAHWIAEKKRERIWRDVIAYDAVDLEQWLEMSQDVALWFATRIGLRPAGVRTLADFWEEFRRATEPEITPSLLLAGRGAAVEKLERWQKAGDPVVRVLADSADEAVSFWAAVLAKSDSDTLSCAIVASDGERVREMMSSSQPLTFGWKLDDPSLLGTVVARGHRVLVPLSKSAAANQPDIELPRLDRGEFIAAIKDALPREAGEAGDVNDEGAAAIREAGDRKRAEEALRRWKKSGPSLTVYRRLFAAHGVASSPEWAASESGVGLLPVLLAGSWSETNEADRKALARLANGEYDSVSRTMALWNNRPDSPIRRIGDTWMLAAPLDSWSLLAGLLTDPVLESYVEVANDVLGEPDPALEMPPEERWLAGIHGRIPAYSSSLRTGLANSLILLAVVGEAAGPQLTVSAVNCSSQVVRKLLGRGVGQTRWASIYRLLPLLAEAAPGVFLDAVLAELRCASPALMVLFGADEHPLGGGSRYPHLLWALEVLAWDPDYLPDVSAILAKLARLAPGKLANSPLNSLNNIFCTWHRNTSASLDVRLGCLDQLFEVEGDVAWKLLLALLPTDHGVSGNNSEPRWREKVAVQPPTYAEIWKAHEELTIRALREAGLRPDRLLDLISKVSLWPVPYRSRFIDQIREFASVPEPEEQKAKMWHRLREFIASHRSYADAKWALAEADILPFEELLGLLAPDEFPDQYVWLFNSAHPNLPRPKSTNYQERDKESEELQRATIRTIFKDRGLAGILKLAVSVDYPGPSIIGAALAEVVPDAAEQWSVLDLTLGSESDKTRNLGIAFVNRVQRRLGITWVLEIVQSPVFRTWTALKASDFCLALPDERSTWDLVETLGLDAQARYWGSVRMFVTPAMAQGDADYAIRKMFDAGRAYDALHCAGSYPEMLPTSLLIDVLNKMFEALPQASEPAQDTMLSYYLERILERLRGDDSVSEEVLGAFEWKYLHVFQFNYSPVTLARCLQRDPVFFADVVGCTFGREEESSEPNGTEPTELESARANLAWKLLSQWHLTPGVREDRTLDGEALADWFHKARSACADRKVRAVGDIEIGKILARVNPGADGVWPPAEVRSLIEVADSEELESGIHSGRINMRGVHARSPFEGGRFEREFVKQYRGWEKAVPSRCLRTRHVLRAIAEIYESMAKHHDISSEALEARH